MFLNTEHRTLNIEHRTEVVVPCSKFDAGRDIEWGDLSEGAEGAVNNARVSGAPGGRAPPCDD